MKANFDSKVKTLKAIANRFDLTSNEQKKSILISLSENKLPLSDTLKSYFEVLLFICAFPPQEEILELAERELSGMSAFLKTAGQKTNKLFTNSGLPFTRYVSGFTHDFVQWLATHPDCKINSYKFENPMLRLNDALKITLPSLERNDTTAGLSNTELFDALGIKKKEQLPFLLNELSRLEEQPLIKDYFYDGLGIYTELLPRNKYFSRGYNRIAGCNLFFHQEILRKFDHLELLNRKITAPADLAGSRKKEIIRVVKNSLALTDRETDPVTYMDENSFRLYELERGISVAIYGMTPPRQMPLESYTGYTLFKNGFPAAYGGGWVFGQRSNFGINIFESFRGGESGYIMCQLLRVFRQVFHVSYFEVEAYQYGLDNPEGIESGAFWFYYRYGFRPLDKKLLHIAKNEFNKIVKNKNYHTGKTTLKKFTESNMALNLGTKIPAGVYDIKNKVRSMIRTKYNGNRLSAEQDCVNKFRNIAALHIQFNPNENRVLKEVALWAAAFKISNREKLDLLIQMIQLKPVDLYQYQELLLRFFKA